MFRRTPPTSDLCTMFGESIFITTGRPISAESTIASAALRATTVCAIGMRKAASSAFDSISLSFLRRSDRAISITRRALSIEGGGRCDSEDGVCISSFWFW